jgi:hypothetical protein
MVHIRDLVAFMTTARRQVRKRTQGARSPFRRARSEGGRSSMPLGRKHHSRNPYGPPSMPVLICWPRCRQRALSGARRRWGADGAFDRRHRRADRRGSPTATTTMHQALSAADCSFPLMAGPTRHRDRGPGIRWRAGQRGGHVGRLRHDPDLASAGARKLVPGQARLN